MADDQFQEFLRALRKGIMQCFDISDLKVLCADLGIDYDSLAGDDKQTKVVDLVQDMRNRGEIKRLLEYCISERPNVYPWPEPSSISRVPVAEVISPEPPPLSRLPIDSINRAKLRFGLSLGWQLARFEFVDGSHFPEAQAVAPTVKRDIDLLLSLDGYPYLSEIGSGYRDMIQAVLSYYGMTDIEKHSAILVGIAAFRTSLIGASKDESYNLAMQQIAFSALQEIDPSILPRKDDFFQLLLRKQPRNVVEILELIDSTDRE